MRGETDYRLVALQGVKRLQATCRDRGASGLVHRARIDLRATPTLHWSWRVAQVYTGLDETQKSGDDFPARVYVAVDGGWRRWQSRALNYVWASRQPRGADWANAYLPQNVRMLALQSGAPAASGLLHEARNVRADLRRYFGRDYEFIDAVALMTDCDDAGGQAQAWYGDIYFNAD